jgi:hypothetical protein
MGAGDQGRADQAGELRAASPSLRARPHLSPFFTGRGRIASLDAIRVRGFSPCTVHGRAQKAEILQIFGKILEPGSAMRSRRRSRVDSAAPPHYKPPARRPFQAFRGTPR